MGVMQPPMMQTSMMFSARGVPGAFLLTTRPHQVPHQVNQRQGKQAAPPLEGPQAAMVGMQAPLLLEKHSLAHISNVLAVLGHSMQEQTYSVMLHQLLAVPVICCWLI